jgi:hypothetical protein
LQRMIEPEEIANLVAYVASPLSSATNPPYSAHGRDSRADVA